MDTGWRCRSFRWRARRSARRRSRLPGRQLEIAPAWNALSSRANSFQSPFALALPKLLKLELVTEPGPGAGQVSPVP